MSLSTLPGFEVCAAMQVWLHVAVILSVFCELSEGDEFCFASYYGEHMVLQRAPEKAVVWGYGTAGAEVQITLAGPQNEQVKSVPVLEGIWKVILDPVQAGGPYNLTAVQKGNKIVLTDVLFGDVWLCGGQSNMAFTLGQVYNASEELAMATKFPNVRVFQAALETSSVELIDLAGVEVPWSRPTPEILGGKDFTHFSAVCWLFGRYLYESLKYPIGLVESCWGGTPVEAWSSLRALQSCGLKEPESRSPVYTFPKSAMSNSLSYTDDEQWNKEWSSTVLWNAMIHPLLSMTIKGAIWYQGEANAQYNQDKYSCTFPAMIDDWRMAFHTGSEGQTAQDFPFGFVQLSTYRIATQDGFPEIRWHQTADYGFVPNERMKKTFMAVAMDLPDVFSPWGSIHPRDKQDVAYRLVLGARAIAYEETGVSFKGPFPIRVLIENTTIIITYDQKIRATLSSGTFEICCSKEKKPCTSGSQWIPAPMKQKESDYVMISIAECPVDNVTALRYAWRDWPCAFKACPIYSADGVLPAPLFIIEQWPTHS
ncbi:sialate O-acetylesterase [Ictalurus punctatus]|uniref:Sialate O-acetylesterase n=2 Tax=Ictalurus punctatus TaxID=7998 RepID=A0A2D0QWS4_ICTPU|nr:sialate O-acetylesterase [Ictalurus punctatus]